MSSAASPPAPPPPIQAAGSLLGGNYTGSFVVCKTGYESIWASEGTELQGVLSAWALVAKGENKWETEMQRFALL